ncbi:uncharacterized protein LOC130657070 [Hydractinia symbiolongicarpus]|uniref:uncharacterized protein LOC130657070 n=1 Tax=Hydractinia symbiolongicarpus TaxID=13093 RepID=UPI00254F93E7|nr:uncharacterized protein LOC130657070 [Hydractinia symbiolongicarpus]
MVTLQSASLPSLPTTSNASEITKYIKQNIDLNHGQEYRSEKVKSRSGHSFDSYRSDDQWKLNMLRRMGQKQCGFFAKTDIPYKECGNVELFSRRLVLNSLQKLGYNFENKVNLHNTEPGLEDKSKENGDVEQGEKTVRKNSSRPRQKMENENGMSEIKECLRKAEKRIVSVKAGQPLNAYIQKEQEEKELRLKQEEEKNNNTLDMLLIDPLEPGGMEVAMTMGNGDKHAKKELSERIKERILIKNKIIFQPKRPTQCRKKSNFVKKLDCLISLLTSINNLKMRDLKTKVPLSKESLKILRKRPLCDPLQPNRLSRKSIMVTNNVVPPAQHLETNKTNRLLPPILFENTSRLELASPAATTIPRKRNFHQRHKNSPVVPSINVTKMETWDDLMSTEANSSRTNSATLELLNNNLRGASRTGVIRKYSMYKRLHQHYFCLTVNQTKNFAQSNTTVIK